MVNTFEAISSVRHNLLNTSLFVAFPKLWLWWGKEGSVQVRVWTCRCGELFSTDFRVPASNSASRSDQDPPHHIANTTLVHCIQVIIFWINPSITRCQISCSSPGGQPSPMRRRKQQHRRSTSLHQSQRLHLYVYQCITPEHSSTVVVVLLVYNADPTLDRQREVL